MSTQIGPNTEVTINNQVDFLRSREPGTYMIRNVQVSSAARDTGNTGNTTTLRMGLAMGKITASSLYKQYDDALVDGSEVFRGFLDHETEVIDEWGVAVSPLSEIVVWGWVDSAKVFGWDANGKIDAQTGANGCLFIVD